MVKALKWFGVCLWFGLVLAWTLQVQLHSFVCDLGNGRMPRIGAIISWLVISLILAFGTLLILGKTQEERQIKIRKFALYAFASAVLLVAISFANPIGCSTTF